MIVKGTSTRLTELFSGSLSVVDKWLKGGGAPLFKLYEV
jgi:hypothetical protein